MLFDTIQYWVFFAFTLAVVGSIPHKAGKAALIVLSYLFYGFWDVRFLLLLGGSTAANYVFGRLIELRKDPSRRLILAIAISFNLTLLAVFKYFNFFVASFASLFGLPESTLILNIALPVGISFFTFESVAYVTDVYRRNIRAVRDPVDFALFVSFFPHLVAGPIIRPANFFPQTEVPATFAAADMNWGFVQILKGLLKKTVFADFFGPIADACFAGRPFEGMMVAPLFGVLAFSLQIYFDFAGYTDIARGCAALLGYRFPPNFERPYLASDIAEFWKRWHISLSSWLRDYLYIPLGGNRLGTTRTGLNLMIVMSLGGLWHGASWNFLVWGFYHGVLLVIHRLWRSILQKSPVSAVAGHPALKPLWIGLTFSFVTIGWIPFRARDLSTTFAMLSGLLTTPDLAFIAKVPGFPILILISVLICVFDRDRRVQDKLVQYASPALMGVICGVAFWLLEVFGQFESTIPFIYFQF